MIQLSDKFTGEKSSIARSKAISVNVSVNNIAQTSGDQRMKSLGIIYEVPVERKLENMKPEGNLLIRSPICQPFYVPFNSWESIKSIKQRIVDHIKCDPEDFHYVTDHGTIEDSKFLGDYRLENNSIILMMRKNQQYKEKMKVRNLWLNKIVLQPKIRPRMLKSKLRPKYKVKSGFQHI